MQISPILARAVASLVAGGRGGVREARGGLPGAAAQHVGQMGAIRV